VRRLGALLSGWSGGGAGRAAAVLIVANLGAVVLAWAGWALFLLPAFSDARLLPSIVMWAFAVVVSMTLLVKLGFWGMVATRGVGHGEHLQGFTPGKALGLGLLRWALQIVMISGVFAAAVVTTVDLRWWHVFGTAEIRGLPDRVAAVPIPDDWEPTSSEVGDDGGNHHPNMRHWLTYDVPAAYTFDDLKAWLSSPAWTDRPDGRSFGAIRVVGCDAEQQACRAQLVPPDGEEPEYFVYVQRSDPSGADPAVAEVDVQVTYRQYVEPDWEVSAAVVARGRAIPVPDEWIRDDEDSSDSRSFGVPETFTPADLEAWITGPRFTDPAAGSPFGAITLDECRSYDGGRHGCDATVDDSWYTDAYDMERARDWVEATLDTVDHTVRVSFRRTDRY
jgi:hypothetical protein